MPRSDITRVPVRGISPTKRIDDYKVLEAIWRPLSRFLAHTKDQIWLATRLSPRPNWQGATYYLLPAKIMSLKVPKANNVQLFKEGYKYLQGIDEAVLRNIQAVIELSDLVRTSFGPNGAFALDAQ